MQPITLRNPITGLERTYNIPTAFHELTQDQFLGAVAIMNRTAERPEMQWLLIGLIMNVPKKDLETLNEVQRVQLLMELNFLYDTKALPYQAMIKSFSTLQYKAVYCPRKIARAFSTTLYGPGDGLGNLNFGEFMAAEQRLEAYNKAPDVHDQLNDFCGILFRKTSNQKKTFEDKRIPFREGLISENGKVFATVSGDVKSAIVLNYMGAKGVFPKMYRKLFPPDLQDETTEQPTAPTAKKKSQSLTWLNTIIAMADRDVTKLDNIKQASLHTVLKVLDETISHNKKMKDEADKHRTR